MGLHSDAEGVKQPLTMMVSADTLEAQTIVYAEGASGLSLGPLAWLLWTSDAHKGFSWRRCALLLPVLPVLASSFSVA